MTTPKRKRAPGGGRPRTVNGVKIAVTLAPADVTYLATLGTNRSAAVRLVIREHRQAKENAIAANSDEGMASDELREIEERANRATLGPWIAVNSDVRTDYDSPLEDMFIGGVFNPDPPANAAFIAHARADVPALIAEVRRLHKELETLREFYME